MNAGFARCYRCAQHQGVAGPLLADAVIPVAYAVKGSQLASDLRRYKWDGDAAAAGRLRALLRAFLAEHGGCVQLAAGLGGLGGSPAGAAGAFSRVAVLPSGQGRPGPHPFEAIVASCVPLPMERLSLGRTPLAHGREVSPDWLRAGGGLAGESVLVIDDAWVSGGSAQSAAVALKLAGAARVATVVLGRHVDPADPKAAPVLAASGGGEAAPAHRCARSGRLALPAPSALPTYPHC